MRAVVATGDGRVAVEERPDPVPGAGEVLVGVKAAGLNAADLLQVRGFYPAPPGSPPDIPGLELAGEVLELGPGATRFSVGDPVMAVVGGGGQADRCAVHERALMPVPTGLPFVEAGGFPEVFTTAHDALFTQAGLVMGERVLVTGAAGGVGTAAVQLAHRAGAKVVASVRNPDLRDDVALLGAAEVCAPEDVGEHGPFDVVLELVGGGGIGVALSNLTIGGRISVIGVSGSGGRAELDLLGLMQRRARIMGSTLRTRPLEQKADAARRVERSVLPHLSAGDIRVPVAAVVPLDDAPAAYERFAAGAKLGKVVLEVS